MRFDPTDVLFVITATALAIFGEGWLPKALAAVMGVVFVVILFRRDRRERERHVWAREDREWAA